MKLFSRQDRLLLAGLTAALLVVFSRQIRYLLDLARAVEQSLDVSLVLPLIILTVVFLFHQQGKRQEAKARVAVAEAESQEAQARAGEFERLVAFGQGLGRSLDVDSIRDVTLRYLEGVTGTRDARVVVRLDGLWQALLGPGGAATPREAADVPPELAQRALDAREPGWESRPVPADGHRWWPMAAGGDIVGYVGLPDSGGDVPPAQRRVLATAATLLAVSLRNADLFRAVRDSSVKDGLTGCFNQTHAIEVIETELRRARRSLLPLSVIMFDIDRFKTINDRHGHLCGDAVLAAIGQCMRDVLRASDVKCRYGGDEFLIVLPDTPIEGALRAADNLHRALKARPIRWQNEALTITASFGVAVAKPAESDTQALLGRADSALYRAKDQGRDRVCLSSEPALA